MISMIAGVFIYRPTRLRHLHGICLDVDQFHYFLNFGYFCCLNSAYVI